jgi:hypothetical protein
LDAVPDVRAHMPEPRRDGKTRAAFLLNFARFCSILAHGGIEKADQFFKDMRTARLRRFARLGFGERLARGGNVTRPAKRGQAKQLRFNFVLFAVTLWFILGEDWLRIKTVRPLAVAVI